MPVEKDITELEFFFMSVLVGKGGFQFAFSLESEFFHFDLFRKVDPVLGHPFVYGFFCAPIDGQLLVLLVVIQIFYLFFGEGFLFDCREIPVQGLDVDAEATYFSQWVMLMFVMQFSRKGLPLS